MQLSSKDLFPSRVRDECADLAMQLEYLELQARKKHTTKYGQPCSLSRCSRFLACVWSVQGSAVPECSLRSKPEMWGLELILIPQLCQLAPGPSCTPPGLSWQWPLQWCQKILHRLHASRRSCRWSWSGAPFSHLQNVSWLIWPYQKFLAKGQYP